MRMRHILPALLLALLLCGCSAANEPTAVTETPAQPVISTEPAGQPTADAPDEPETIPDGIAEQNGAARYYSGGEPVTASGLTELDGLLLYFQPDGMLYRFVRGVNRCGDSLYYHTGEDGYVLLSPEAGLFDDGGALYDVQDDLTLLAGGADGYLTFDADGRYTSGSEEIDEGVAQLLLTACDDPGAPAQDKLHAAFDYIRDNYRYLSAAHYDAGTTDWAQDAAELFLRQGKGNCYCFAALFMYCARRLGYQAYVVAGQESRADNDHAWTMIDEADGTYLYDVQLEYAYLYQFDRGAIDAFRMSEGEDGLYNGFRYYFP